MQEDEEPRKGTEFQETSLNILELLERLGGPRRLALYYLIFFLGFVVGVWVTLNSIPKFETGPENIQKILGNLPPHSP